VDIICGCDVSSKWADVAPTPGFTNRGALRLGEEL